MDFLHDKINTSQIPSAELQAQQLVTHGKIDQAIAIYDQIKPETVRIFMIIGTLYAQNRGDYQSAIVYYGKALEMEQKNGNDTSRILIELGIAYQNLSEFDLALDYYFRALNTQKLAHRADQQLVVDSLVGITNCYWGQQKLIEALEYAQRAVRLNESMKSGNELNLAISLAALANIYYNSGDDHQALETSRRALMIAERCVPSDSLILASFLNNLGTIQCAIGLVVDSQLTFSRAQTICQKNLPKGHPQRSRVEDNISRVNEMAKQNNQNCFSRWWQLSLKTIFSS